MVAISNSTLERIRFAAQGWGAIFNDNMQRLEDLYLTIPGMGDVEITSLADKDILQYNGTDWVNVSSGFLTTTTTSTTTTS